MHANTPSTFTHTPESLLYAVDHIFFPANPLNKTVFSSYLESALARAVCAAAHAHSPHIDNTCEPQWHRITRMLGNFQEFVQSVSEGRDRERVISQLHEIQTGDFLAFLIRWRDQPRASGILLMKKETRTMFQTFDMSTPNEPGTRSYPASAMEVPNVLFHDAYFQFKLANLLSRRSDKNYFAQFLASLHNDILQSVVYTVDVPLITKHIRVRDNPIHMLYRSPLWLFIKVVIRITLDRSPFPTGRGFYKAFMLFFMCTLASDANIATLHTDLLHLMACKIQRSLSKLEPSIPDWLSRITQSVLENLGARLSPFRNPSQDELKRDTRLSLTCSQDYIRNALANHNGDPPPSAFVSHHRGRGTIHHFLSSNRAFYEEEWDVNRHVAFYDAEKIVEEDIDDWIANVSDVDGACSQLEILMDGYMLTRTNPPKSDSIGYSIALLTGIELFIALDKLLVKEIPLLSNYSPEIPAAALESLVTYNQTNLHRISRAYQYLSARQLQSRMGWSVVSDEDSLPVRYYNQSPHLQQLKSQIERDAMDDGLREEQRHLSAQKHAAGGFRSPLPSSPMHAKVIVFELQCPLCIRIWRSAAVRLWYYFSHYYDQSVDREEKEENMLRLGLQQHYVNRDEPKIGLQFAYFYLARSENNPPLHYEVRHHDSHQHYIWRGDQNPEYWKCWWEVCKPSAAKFDLNDTSRTPNDTLAAQADCPANISLEEFVAYGQLRNGGFLQWFNALHGIHSRTLKLHSEVVHDLLFCTISQVGPLDLNTGTWLWHKELDDSSFCMVLLDELENLFADVGAQVIDRMMVHSISLLLTRVLASSPSETILDRTIKLLQKVRRKMFDWVQELSYNLGKKPSNEIRRNLLRDMSYACLSTFDVDTTTLWKHFLSEEDISAALFCTLLTDGGREDYDLHGYRCRLFIAFESVLSDAILLDPTDRGIDLAVRMFFPSHKPGLERWEKLEYPNSHWLTCRTGESIKKPSEMVHVNLLDGDLQIDGRSICKLFEKIRESWQCKQISPDQGLFVLPQVTSFNQGVTPKQKARFFLRDDDLVVQMICNNSKETLEWIPSHVLCHDLPTPLLDGHIHWLNLTRGIINILPLERPLNPSPEDWRIVGCVSGQYRAYKGSEMLVDKWSLTWAVMSNCFQGLNVCWSQASVSDNEDLVHQVNNLVMTTLLIKSQSPSMLTLSIKLPRHGLSFFINKQGELESRDFKNMIYDKNPQLGETLSGIDCLFILRQRADLPEGLIPRRILVPDGIPTRYIGSGALVRFKDGEELYYKLLQAKDQLPTYHVYDVDIELGCLIGNGSLRNTRQLAYMLALTSQDDRRDPFTGKTGLQAAVSLLRSGGCRSISKFSYLWEDEKDPEWITVHPEVNMAHDEIQERYYWRCSASSAQKSGSSNASQEQQNNSAKPPSEISPFHLFSKRSVPAFPPRIILPSVHHKSSPDHLSEVNRLLASLEVNDPCSSFQLDYIARLTTSALAARKESHVTFALPGKEWVDTLHKHYLQCRANYFGALAMLNETLSPSNDSREQDVNQPDTWPLITGDTLLRCLASTSSQTLPGQWKNCLVSLALLLLDLQRARRLLRFALDGLEEEFSKELEHVVCDGWDPEEYPDWLLIQIQGNFLIRRSQAEVAMEMISPKSGRNTVMQVNMGEGKSSVIIPMVAAALADGKQLARVMVPKQLTVQMFDLLISRLGWLVNRPIYHLPFSRTPERDSDGVVIGLQIDDMHKLMLQCMAERGILLVQPEHVASLRLMCIEGQICRKSVPRPLSFKIRKLLYFDYIKKSSLLRLVPEESFIGSTLRWLSQSADHWDGKVTAHMGCEAEDSLSGHRSAVSWMDLQNWMDSHIRDILDESDETLHSRFQLIYTIGFEQHIEGYPDRWTITQQVLRLVTESIPALVGYFQIDCGPPGSFPLIGAVSDSDIGQRLRPLVTEFVMRGRIGNLDFRDLTPELQSAIRNFISDEDVLPVTVKRVEEYAKNSDQACMWTALLVLRGLLAFDILLFALLERRWRVDYGIGRSTMLAVPYRAKDMPAPNTQFGHPDITIVLTCLSYYYSGLSEEQLRISFQILLDQDDPHAEYAFWVKDYTDGKLPESLQILGEMNLRSSEQWDKVIYPLFYRNQAAIDLYLSCVVFPKEAKEFPFKISSSSWDLVGKREKVTTGFSGTDDGRWLLPMTVGQRDLDHQHGTNARVLAYLLQPENDFYMTITGENGERLATTDFLQTITSQQPEIRVLLDVGAQILDSPNRHVAETWLDIVRDAAGAIYFDEKDELIVLMRNARMPVPMLTSSLSQQLERCVVYLDHAHTRGTDLKLPIGLRAAVTLGPRLTKDRLVQGCMRMRKLGHGHSVMFFAPLEVDKSIRAKKTDPNSRITITDIFRWAIHEIWIDIQHRAPYWAQQGMDHRSREDAWFRFCNKAITSKQLSDVWLQRAAKPLDDLFAPRERSKELCDLSMLDDDIQQRCKDLGVMSLSCVQIEEQEREVNREREREREEDLPPKAEPADHFLHPDVKAFVETGVIPALYSSSAFRPIFTTLRRSSATTREVDAWSPSILATEDFCNTIKPESTKGTIDQYLRPVQWVLSSQRDGQILVLISPFEASRLLSEIRSSEFVHLHLYAPRKSQRMRPCDDLTFYAIPSLPPGWAPPWALIDQLNVFAGQLYLDDHNSYMRLCRFLGVPTDESPSAVSMRRNIRRDLFGSVEGRESKFSCSPLPFVMALLAIRNRGKPFWHTHMGKILYGQVLRGKDFVPRYSDIKLRIEDTAESPMKLDRLDGPVSLSS